MKRIACSAAILFVMLSVFITPGVQAAPPQGSGGPEVSPAVQHDVSAPLRDMTAAPVSSSTKHEKELRPLIHPSPRNLVDPVVQNTQGPLVATTAGLNFAGVGNGDYGFSPNSAPPDTEGSVGATQYVQWVNSSFAVFNKSTGALVYGPVAGNTLWSGFGGGCQTNNDGDPIVRYDQAANRWVFTQFSVSTTPYLQCVAVSQTSDATGAYNRYAFSYGNTQFPDYPKLGVWPDAYYISYNIFNNGSTFGGAKVCAFDRSAMLTGSAATQVCFQLSTSFGGLLPSDLDGTTSPPAGSPNTFVAFGNDSASLDIWKFHVDFATPANSTLVHSNIPAPAFVAACSGGGTCIPQSGTSQKLDSLADRVMYRLAYRNFGDHESWVVNHSVTAGSSVGIRWYEIRSPNGTPVVYQSGTFAPDSSYRWMGSIAMDKAGNIAVGYSVSSSSMFPSIRYTGRAPSDPLGTLQAENTITTGGGSQTTGLSRWGDYSAMTVDPTDDCTFFYTTEYLKANGTFNWSTRIASFKFPSCGNPPVLTTITVSPASASVQTGGTQQFTATGLDQFGQPLSPQPTFTWSVSGGGTINSSGLFTAGSTAGGPFTVTAASGSVSGTATVTVTAPVSNDFSISASPTALSISQGSSGTSTISTAVTSGSAGTVSLSASVSPAGPTANLNPTSVTAGGSSILTISVGASVATGSYTVTVTGTEGSATHSAAVTVTVTAPVSNDFSISASPTAVSISQGSSGTSTISTAVTSGSAGTVSLSASVSPAGPTASLNPTSVTAGGSSTLTISVGASVATGSYTVTVTGTEGSATHSAAVTVTVTAPVTNDFSISASPTALSISQGSSGTSTISTAVTSGSAGTVSLSASVSPAGPTASLNPTSVTAGGSSTLTISVGASVATGSYTVTVTGTEGTATHSAAVAVTVTASSGGGLVNGGFETGTLSGWTSAGSTGISTVAHSGTYSARVGATTPISGDSSITQTFTAPSAGGTLSFYYQVHCPDTVTYDWATATLRDNTAGNTVTVLSKTCTNSSSWVQASGVVTGGHSYTLTLISHDDNYPGDPTYTLYDDAAISAPPPPGQIVNGGFETGTLSGWTSAGSTGISTVAHSGTYSARVGATTPTSGDSSITQTFTAPSGVTKLSFYYQVHCPDTVTYDWATATLRDNTAGTTVTVLSKTCTNSSSWVQASTAVTVGHSYTLILISHDDNYPGDPTYVLYDDVAVN